MCMPSLSPFHDLFLSHAASQGRLFAPDATLLCFIFHFRALVMCLSCSLCHCPFSSSSANPPSPTPLSAALRSRRWYRRHPSSPPRGVSLQSVIRLPRLWSSLWWRVSLDCPVKLRWVGCVHTFYWKVLKLIILFQLCGGLLRLQRLASVFRVCGNGFVCVCASLGGAGHFDVFV